MTDPDTRPQPPFVGGETEQTAGFLDFLRETVVLKSSGLSEEDAHRPVLPSRLMTVAGVLSHLRWVEAYWFGVVLSGEPDRAPYSREAPDGEFEVAADLPLARLIADYQAQCQVSRRVAAGMEIDSTVPFRGDGRVNLRWVLLHMVEETGRHAGHLDIIRELLDGVTGE